LLLVPSATGRIPLVTHTSPGTLLISKPYRVSAGTFLIVNRMSHVDMVTPSAVALAVDQIPSVPDPMTLPAGLLTVICVPGLGVAFEHPAWLVARPLNAAPGDTSPRIVMPELPPPTMIAATTAIATAAADTAPSTIGRGRRCFAGLSTGSAADPEAECLPIAPPDL
jgi:hypothetical protein